MITFDQFITEHKGRLIDVDGSFGGQCWDLVAAYDQEVVGVPGNVFWGLPAGPDGYAREVYQYFPDPLPKYYDKLPLSATPQKGDVVVWGAGPGDEPGHIAIFVSGNLQNFTSFDQNWPLGSAPHMQNHNANYVIGFLRPKVNQGDDMATKEQLIEMYKLAFPNQPVNGDWVNGWTGKNMSDAIQALRDDPSRQAYITRIVNDADAYEQLPASDKEVNVLGQALLKILNALGYKKS